MYTPFLSLGSVLSRSNSAHAGIYVLSSLLVSRPNLTTVRRHLLTYHIGLTTAIASFHQLYLGTYPGRQVVKAVQLG